MSTGMITINEEDLKELKALYEKAPPGGIFMFKNREVLKEYAKYMIEYLESPQMSPIGNNIVIPGISGLKGGTHVK